jgi:kynurenine 3-monooxygenase
MTSSSNARLVVVGGGLVGSLLAIYLSRRGHGVDVFDRKPDPRRSNGTARRPSLNLTLCERGLAALDAVGLRERALALAVPAKGRRIHTVDGEIVYQPYGNHGEAIFSIARSALNALLVEEAERTRGVAYHFEQKCVHVDARTAQARFEHTRTGELTEVRSTKIFGADGAYSGVRLQLQKSELFDYSQQYSAQGYKELAIPAGSTQALQADALHIWPRGDFMLMAFPNPDGSFTGALYAPFDGEESFEALGDETRLSAFMHEHFPDVASAIPNLSEQFFARPANTMLTVRCRPWSRAGNVLLVGDAAHSVLPWYGQGANAGFEDVLVLDHCMRTYGDDWEGAFAELEQLRRPNMDVMADLCNDHFHELRDRVADPRFLLRKALERRLQELFPDRFAPLYSMVAFTRTPYAEAVRIDRVQRRVIDRLLGLDGIEAQLRGPEMVSIARHCMQEVV